MRTLEYEYEQAADAFSIEGEINGWQKAVLAPIVLPMSIFWSIIDFFVSTLPDTVLGIDTSEEAATKKLDAYYAAYDQRMAAEQAQRKAEIRQALWPEHYSNQ